MPDNLTSKGFTVFTLPAELMEILVEISSGLVQLINVLRRTDTDENKGSELTNLRKVLATGLAQNDPAACSVVEHILQTAHNSIVQIPEDLVPALAELARSLGFDAEPHRAIARFRIASNAQSNYDHRWHQDSIDSLSTSKDQRTTNLGFWIPFHDVGSTEGSIEFSPGSHTQPIDHTETDACGRLYFPKEQVRAYKKQVVPVPIGNILAFDSWVAHRTVPNISNRVRIALLVWF